MSIRPNIQSPLKLENGELIVRGESDLPVFDVLQVVVFQKGEKAGGQGEEEADEIAEGPPKRVSANWRAILAATGFETGPAEALGVEIRVDPFTVTSWTQSVEIT